MYLDGQLVGTTPLSGLVASIGTHEILFRNPQLGERRETVAVKARSPVRVGVDLIR